MRESEKDTSIGFRVGCTQAICLSEYAYGTLLNDCYAFNCINANGVMLSRMINIIFLSYYSQAQASISKRCKDQEEDWKEVMSVEVPEKYIKSYRKKLVERMQRLLKTNASEKVTIKLRADMLQVLEHSLEASKDTYPSNHAARYIRAVVEEYCGLQFSERERIFLSEIKDKVNGACSNGQILNITSMEGIEYRFLPLQVSYDNGSRHTYMRGFRVDDIEKKIFSIRLDLPKQISVGHEKVSKADYKVYKALLDNAKREAFSQSADSEMHLVTLTENGLMLFRRIAQNRPRVVKCSDMTYTFCADAYKIKTYFLPFGKEAFVHDEKIRREMQEFYSEAAEAYASVDDYEC